MSGVASVAGTVARAQRIGRPASLPAGTELAARQTPAVGLGARLTDEAGRVCDLTDLDLCENKGMWRRLTNDLCRIFGQRSATARLR